MLDLFSMTWGEVVDAAKTQSGLTCAEITRGFNKATGGNMSPANVQRWFSPYDNYWPSAQFIPVLSAVLGNTLMSDWLALHSRPPQQQEESCSMGDILRMMPRLARELGDVGKVLDEVLGDGDFSADDAKQVRRELLDIRELAGRYLDKLAVLSGDGSVLSLQQHRRGG